MKRGLALFAITLLSACQGKMEAAKVQAPSKIGDSVGAVVAGQIDSDTTYNLTIERASLEKEFLLQGEIIAQTTAAMGSSLKSRIVAFRERGGKLYMLEASAGHVVTTDLPPNILLAEFPIVSSDSKKIVFDFNQGMSRLFAAGDMAAPDLEGRFYNAAKQFRAVELAKSFIESAKLDGSNHLVVRQVAQLKTTTGLNPVEVRYYLSPYTATVGYAAAKAGPNFDHQGFFQTQPQWNPASDYSLYNERWNPKAPVVYAVSANTPPEYRQAVKEGILYWNKVAGHDMVQAIDAPAGTTAPDANYNIIQWVPFDSAGFAYADMQADPRTGEIQHAQVFLTSAFAFFSKESARHIVRKLRAAGGASGALGHSVQLTGFEQEAACDYDASKYLATALESLLITDVDDAAVLKAAQDYVRFVTAHEVGHTLGLRHNFAGSLVGNYPLSTRADLVAKYFALKAAPPGIEITSSVMDYITTEEDFMAGDQMLHGKVLPYDQKAIASLYQDAKFKAEDWPLFCTDSGIGTYYDCNVFDLGSSPIEFNSWQTQDMLTNLPNSLIEQYIVGKTPFGDQEITPVEEVALANPASYAQMMLAWRLGYFQQLAKNAKILKVQRQFPVASAFNDDVVNRQQLSYLTGEVQRLGGYAALFGPLPADYVDKSVARVDVLLQDIYKKGVGGGEKTFAFSDDEIKVIKANTRIFFEKFAKEYHRQELEVLAGTGLKDVKFVQDPAADQLATYLTERARQVLLSTTGEVMVVDLEIPNPDTTAGVPKTVMKSVKLPQFLYTTHERITAAGLLDADRSEDPSWALAERSILHDDMAKLLTDALGGVTPDKIKLSKVNKDVARWLAENGKVLAAIK